MARPAMRRVRRRSQRLINHNCFNSINHVILRAFGAQSSICFCWSISCRDGQASNGPEQPRAPLSRSLAVPCADCSDGNRSQGANRHVGPVQLNARQPGDVAGFAAAPDRGGGKRSAQQSEAAGQRQEQARTVADRSDPKYGLPAASGAADSGYDSLNRTRKKQKYYPGQARPKPPVGPGSPPPPMASNTRLRLSIPSSESAHKTPIAPAMAGTVAGQPPRKRLRLDDDPFGAVGDYAGSFLIKSAVEFSGGYDTNPGRLAPAQGKPFYVIALEFLAVSDWERHALVADLRGSFTGYGSNLTPNADGTPLSAPLDIDRPSFIGHVDGRLDVSRDTRLGAQGRVFVSTDNPGSPNVQAGPAGNSLLTPGGGHLGDRKKF